MTDDQSSPADVVAGARKSYRSILVVSAVVTPIALFLQMFALIATGFISSTPIESSRTFIDSRREDLIGLLLVGAIGPIAVAGVALGAFIVHRRAGHGLRNPIGALILMGLDVLLLFVFAMLATNAIVELTDLSRVEKTLPEESEVQPLTAQSAHTAFATELARINEALGADAVSGDVLQRACGLPDERIGIRYHTDVTQVRVPEPAIDVVQRLNTVWGEDFRITSMSADQPSATTLRAQPGLGYSTPVEEISVVLLDDESATEVHLESFCTLAP